jgi:predicted membrane protein
MQHSSELLTEADKKALKNQIKEYFNKCLAIIVVGVFFTYLLADTGPSRWMGSISRTIFWERFWLFYPIFILISLYFLSYLIGFWLDLRLNKKKVAFASIITKDSEKKIIQVDYQKQKIELSTEEMQALNNEENFKLHLGYFSNKVFRVTPKVESLDIKLNT